MRTLEDISNMSRGDAAIGLEAHYKPLANLINERGFKTCIEIGTAYGNSAEYVLKNTQVDILMCIDPFQYYTQMPGLESQSDYNVLRDYTVNKLSQYEAFIHFHKTSREALILFEDMDNEIHTDVDFVFLDGDHSYETVKWECDNYSKLLRKGTILSGHDWDIFESVNKAVTEFANENGHTIHTLHGNIWYINL